MPHSHPSSFKIFVLGNGSLLDEGISDMLIPHSQLNVIRITYTDDHTLYDLVNLEHPYAVFISEFDTLDMERVINSIFSVPSSFVRGVIVIRDENSELDVYYRPTTDVPVTTYRRKSIVVNSKEEFINLALRVSSDA